MKLARFGLLILGILLMLSSLASAYTYQGHYSNYYGSSYRPYYNYHHYGPAVYTNYPHYTIGMLGDGYYYHRYYPVNYYYYRQPYYVNYRYAPVHSNWWAW